MKSLLNKNDSISFFKNLLKKCLGIFNSVSDSSPICALFLENRLSNMKNLQLSVIKPLNMINSEFLKSYKAIEFDSIKIVFLRHFLFL